jgi:hypothetical protein
MDAATESKTTVENAQREVRATGVKHTTRFFELRDDNCWVPRIQCVVCLVSSHRLLVRLVPTLKRKIKCSYYCRRLPQDPQEATAAVQAWVWSRLSEGNSAPAEAED